MSQSLENLSIIAVDTGGTFTDVVYLDRGRVRIRKVPSTPEDPALAVLTGIRQVLSPQPAEANATAADGAGTEADSGAAPAFVLVHGSTVATNALLERRGARVALVTNRGFEDVLEIGRQNRPQLYALVGSRAPALVAAEDRHGVAGRLGPDGTEEEPLEPSELTGLGERLREAESIAICLLHSYANRTHEEEVARALAALEVPLSVSSELLPEYREYERMSTTVVNAYVAPRMDAYLGRLETESGAARLRVMGSGGGTLPVARARREAVLTVLSGPAGGVAGALEVGHRSGVPDLITFDMGGTSTDVSLCPGRPLHTRDFTIAGSPVATPVLDIHTVGAGGGSIARIDAGGALRVGPESAGADPGPICYGRGGREVTVTDAHVWLGRIPAGAFTVRGRPLDRDSIQTPLRALAERLDFDEDHAAEGILAVANTAMEGALRVISVERGYDPTDFTLLPFGGAAALHAAELAARLGIPRLLVPPDPGVLSAYGMLVSPVRKDVSRTVLLDAAEASAERLETEYRQLEATALEAMTDEGIPARSVRLRRTVDARYHGQSYELRVTADRWVMEFHELHEARYGYRRDNARVEAVTLRVEATSPSVPAPEIELPEAESPDPAPASHDDVAYQGERVLAARYARADLRVGHRFQGPAIVTEYSATTWVPIGWSAEVDATGALVVSRI